MSVSETTKPSSTFRSIAKAAIPSSDDTSTASGTQTSLSLESTTNRIMAASPVSITSGRILSRVSKARTNGFALDPPMKVSKESGVKIQRTHSQKSDADPIDQLLSVGRNPLPSPQPPSNCPVFCCFYAEFDIIVGPKVGFQSPEHFMDQDTGIPTEEIHQILAETFARIRRDNEKDDCKNVEARNAEDTKDAETNEKIQGEGSEDGSREGSLSIFDSTSEYIITGNELAGKMINISTHNMHILTRPTVIADDRYERNALLFCVGFVLRRTEDPRPFRPLLAKWAFALRSMEVESQFLTKPHLRKQLQPMLDRLLLSLNSWQRECNMLLDRANAVNLKLFKPPKPPALAVPDHAVPVLVQENLLNLYDWDLTIKWVALHIDGVNNAQSIAAKSDVDMEMVRACLRVLKHHGVIALVDMFFYSNRYEFTERASTILAGKDPKLLQEAFEFVARRRRADSSSSPGPGSEHVSANSHMDFVPISDEAHSPSYPPMAQSISNSFKASSLKFPSIPGPHDSHSPALVRREQRRMKTALAELYCSCHRNLSFADLLASKTSEPSNSMSTGIFNNKRTSPADDNNTNVWSTETGKSTSHLFSHDPRIVPIDTTPPEQEKKKGVQYGTDWTAVFQYFDHRRFATFGIIHGLLRRVHNYPFVVDTNGIPNNPDQSIQLLTGSSRLVAQTDNGNSHRGVTYQRGEGDVARRAASMMDGTRCDDELVCEFDKPLEDLIHLVKAGAKKIVVSIYSAGSS